MSVNGIQWKSVREEIWVIRSSLPAGRSVRWCHLKNTKQILELRGCSLFDWWAVIDICPPLSYHCHLQTASNCLSQPLFQSYSPLSPLSPVNSCQVLAVSPLHIKTSVFSVCFYDCGVETVLSRSATELLNIMNKRWLWFLCRDL